MRPQNRMVAGVILHMPLQSTARKLAELEVFCLIKISVARRNMSCASARKSSPARCVASPRDSVFGHPSGASTASNADSFPHEAIWQSHWPRSSPWRRQKPPGWSASCSRSSQMPHRSSYLALRNRFRRVVFA